MFAPMSLVDSHCHLDFPQFEDQFDDVMERAAQSGVGVMMTISTRIRQFEKLAKIVEAYDNIYCTIGTHPHNAAEEQDIPYEDLIGFCKHPKVIGIGEAGLDYYYDHSPRDVQAEVFRRHIRAARKAGLPLVIHSRDAEDDTAEILAHEMKQGAFKPLLHCFSSDIRLAKRGLELGCMFSFSGILTFKAAEPIRDAARLVPLDRVLVETDAPYLAPTPYRGKTNEPAFVAHTAAKLAEVKDVSLDELAKATTNNFFNLFTKAQRPQEM